MRVYQVKHGWNGTQYDDTYDYCFSIHKDLFGDAETRPHWARRKIWYITIMDNNLILEF
jgi:hypothetical protein